MCRLILTMFCKKLWTGAQEKTFSLVPPVKSWWQFLLISEIYFGRIVYSVVMSWGTFEDFQEISRSCLHLVITYSPQRCIVSAEIEILTNLTMSEKKPSVLLRVRQSDSLSLIYVYFFSTMGTERMIRKSYCLAISH